MSTHTNPPASAPTEKDDAVFPAVFHDELGLDEISLVPRGANHGADVLVFKASDTDDPARSPLQRIRALTHSVLDRLSSLVVKHDIPADEAAPILASLESAAIIGAVAKDDGAPTPEAATPAAPEPPTTEGASMSGTAAEQSTPPAAQTATAESVAKMNDQLAEAVRKAEAAESALAIYAARVEKMEQAARDRELTEKVDALLAGVPGDRGAFKALVAKCDDADLATLSGLVGFAREAAKSADLFGSRGTVAKSASSGSAAESAFDAKVTEIRAADRLSEAEATVKAASLYPELANAVAAEHRARVASTK